ncbi:MAG TPA: hypothetical protein DG761_03870 [Gammaproteobacteria bacterium]|jgi:hypothetical protein|nr:hypothetical protein [Acidiferrobacteraceae bacterium]MDP6552450.1 hypothetical protein [Arenicellales bacterium]MDP6792093.1 hypothetical protein [Arenicellales bacterium]MDP6918264.1 hypothetical protein [Arenicellales bacterium]HCX87139.1 hypothetical protein [Gammaproteobacteria bacterium]|tara:strand:- start:394 stop:675 length:282 start_codon:yes stop_codon:yes gene_type:complete
MRDFIDFLMWSGFTLISAGGFSQWSGVYVEGLDGPELMALGLCASVVGGSGALLMLRGLFRVAVGLPLLSKLLSGGWRWTGTMKPLGGYLAHG